MVLFLYQVYRALFVKDVENMIAKWKIALLLLIISSVLFFVFFTTAIGELGMEQTISDGYDTFVIKSNSYMQAFNLMPLVVGVYAIQWLFFIIYILQGFSFFGRSRMSLE